MSPIICAIRRLGRVRDRDDAHPGALIALPGVIKQFREEVPSRPAAAPHQAVRPHQEIVARLPEEEARISASRRKASRRPPSSSPFLIIRGGTSVIADKRNDPFAGRTGVDLAEIAQRPIVTYGQGFTGRPLINAAFQDRGLAPDIVVSAIDSDVIKSYVALGLGLGIITEVAYAPESDRDLVKIAEGLFPEATSYIAVPRGRFLPGYAHRFIELCRPELEAPIVRAAIGAEPK